MNEVYLTQRQDFNCETIVLTISVPMIKGKHDISYTEVDPGEDPTMLAIIAKKFKLFTFIFLDVLHYSFYVPQLINSGIKREMT